MLFTDPNIAHDPEYDDRMMDMLRALRPPKGFSTDVRELVLRERAARMRMRRPYRPFSAYGAEQAEGSQVDANLAANLCHQTCLTPDRW